MYHETQSFYFEVSFPYCRVSVYVSVSVTLNILNCVDLD